MTCSIVNQHINVGEKKTILRISLVDVSKVNTNSNFAIFFRIETTLTNHSGYSTIDRNPTLSYF